MTRNFAQRRYGRDVMWLMLAYVVVLGAALAVFFTFHGRPGLFVWPIAILPALPLIGVIAALARYLATEPDEFMRLLALRRVLFSTGLTLTVATIWGFLEFFKLVPHLNAALLVSLWFAGQWIGALINRATLGSW